MGTTIDQPDDTGQAHAFGAPASRQDKNGLVEILWKFIITLARNWLTSNYLPKSFWYFAVRPATIVSNYMPLQLADRTWTSPFEQVYNVKPDWQNLVPMFSVAYVKRLRDADVSHNTSDSKTIHAICVGNDPDSDSLLFYLPHSCQCISSSDYTLDPSLPSGPGFGLHYDGKLHCQPFSPSSPTITPPVFSVNDTV